LLEISPVPRPKRAATPPPECPTVPFRDAEEAWFWFAHCQLLRNAGARFDRMSGQTQRPCDPDDIYRAATALRRRGRIGPRHIAVLARFGAALRVPDERLPSERHAASLWEQAMDALTTTLRSKGIIEPIETHDLSA